MPTTAARATVDSCELSERAHRVRQRSLALIRGLSAEDMQVQVAEHASPTKWHLAHTSWFFERFILTQETPGYRVFHADFDYLFNSYYVTAGSMHPRGQRGFLSRPGIDDVLAYRQHVDDALQDLLASPLTPALRQLVELGLHHEQQHQELLLTDIKQVLAANPLEPALRTRNAPRVSTPPPALAFLDGPEGVCEIGHAGDAFAFDNEGPRHRVFLHSHRLANRLVTNAEYRDFIRDGGYDDPALWLSDGWALKCDAGWQRPLYWDSLLETEFTLAGRQPIDPHAPATHLSFYEADAYARWAGARLPTEAEWELAAAASLPESGLGLDTGDWHPTGGDDSTGMQQLFGQCWQWTASAYSPYPGYRPPAGAIGEYNGKFMCNQMVLRGSSCATPDGHARTTYRNFFYPSDRWQFSGIRLAH
ncbi:ergothioneine biosynthesis protein EgtB [Chromatocurvus halotolerans]|uniref:Ergothioneine biosynthesis protein EgtB n=1 Tax=Chromatocurvus halotolerans TaxID=1132028 RepID=A0A4R2KS52_9GAMM|nr:ergothioneine biosynthesis protein EgtB [Chromatocurvus halotolerans]TCO77131.1 ergothioneine biosynthesis protein EgtB [Chromatocurvus halotolerans]